MNNTVQESAAEDLLHFHNYYCPPQTQNKEEELADSSASEPEDPLFLPSRNKNPPTSLSLSEPVPLVRTTCSPTRCVKLRQLLAKCRALREHGVHRFVLPRAPVPVETKYLDLSCDELHPLAKRHAEITKDSEENACWMVRSCNQPNPVPKDAKDKPVDRPILVVDEPSTPPVHDLSDLLEPDAMQYNTAQPPNSRNIHILDKNGKFVMGIATNAFTPEGEAYFTTVIEALRMAYGRYMRQTATKAPTWSTGTTFATGLRHSQMVPESFGLYQMNSALQKYAELKREVIIESECLNDLQFYATRIHFPKVAKKMRKNFKRLEKVAQVPIRRKDYLSPDVRKDLVRVLPVIRTARSLSPLSVADPDEQEEDGPWATAMFLGLNLELGAHRDSKDLSDFSSVATFIAPHLNAPSARLKSRKDKSLLGGSSLPLPDTLAPGTLTGRHQSNGAQGIQVDHVQSYLSKSPIPGLKNDVPPGTMKSVLEINPHNTNAQSAVLTYFVNVTAGVLFPLRNRMLFTFSARRHYHGTTLFEKNAPKHLTLYSSVQTINGVMKGIVKPGFVKPPKQKRKIKVEEKLETNPEELQAVNSLRNPSVDESLVLTGMEPISEHLQDQVLPTKKRKRKSKKLAEQPSFCHPPTMNDRDLPANLEPENQPPMEGMSSGIALASINDQTRSVVPTGKEIASADLRETLIPAKKRGKKKHQGFPEKTSIQPPDQKPTNRAKTKQETRKKLKEFQEDDEHASRYLQPADKSLAPAVASEHLREIKHSAKTKKKEDNDLQEKPRASISSLPPIVDEHHRVEGDGVESQPKKKIKETKKLDDASASNSTEDSGKSLTPSIEDPASKRSVKIKDSTKTTKKRKDRTEESESKRRKKIRAMQTDDAPASELSVTPSVLPTIMNPKTKQSQEQKVSKKKSKKPKERGKTKKLLGVEEQDSPPTDRIFWDRVGKVIVLHRKASKASRNLDTFSPCQIVRMFPERIFDWKKEMDERENRRHKKQIRKLGWDSEMCKAVATAIETVRDKNPASSKSPVLTLLMEGLQKVYRAKKEKRRSHSQTG